MSAGRSQELTLHGGDKKTRTRRPRLMKSISLDLFVARTEFTGDF